MARSKDEWITSKQAAAILTENSGHPVSETYVRRLASQGKIETKEIDGRTKLYSKNDAQDYRVKVRGKKEEAVA